jgi:hypothetical protein
MKHLKARFGFASVTNASARMIDASPDRVMVVIHNPIANQVTVTAEQTAIFGQGPTLQLSSPALEIFGDAARANLQAIANVAGPTLIGFIEYFDPLMVGESDGN